MARNDSDTLRLIRRRGAILRALREWFHGRGFTEVETPCRVLCPGLEPHLVAFPAGDGHYLATSPELHLKRLLAAGAEKIFEIAHAFRGDETGPWHRREFLMLEWYRAREPLTTVMDDAEQIVRSAARAAGRLDRPVRSCDLRRPAERLTVREAFLRYAGVDLAALQERRTLTAALRKLGLSPSDDDTWDDLFFKLFLDRVEPYLGRDRMTILSEYPASQAALARIRLEPGEEGPSQAEGARGEESPGTRREPAPAWPVALRFELYAGGVELANAFDELTDPVEQRRRHEADRTRRREMGREVPPLDESFLAALEAGMPPAAGIALGLDRLIALLLDAETIHDAMLFPEE